TRLDDDRILNNRVIAGADQLSATGAVQVPLLAPRGWVAWSHARDNVEIARMSGADIRRQVAVATARAYLTVLAQRRVVDVSRLARDAARAHHQFAVERRSGGIGNRIDEVRAGQELATDEAQLEAAQAALVRAREALGVLLGAGGPVDTADEP